MQFIMHVSIMDKHCPATGLELDPKVLWGAVAHEHAEDEDQESMVMMDDDEDDGWW